MCVLCVCVCVCVCVFVCVCVQVGHILQNVCSNRGTDLHLFRDITEFELNAQLLTSAFGFP